MRIRRRSPWATKFGRFVRQQTVAGLVLELRKRDVPVTNMAVYRWVGGFNRPSSAATEALLAIGRGSLTFDDLARHRRVAVRSRVAGTV